MPSGGDRRPLAKVLERDVEYGAFLLGTMWAHASPRGKLFRQEYASMFRRYRRLLKALDTYTPLGAASGPPGEMHALVRWLELVLRTVPVGYPRPRALTADEYAEIAVRDEIVARIATELEIDNSASGALLTVDSDWMIVLNALAAWVHEVVDEAHAGIRQRTSHRVVVRQYYAEVEALATRWRLDAWWAVPALVHSQSISLVTGRLEPMQVVGYCAQWQSHYTLIAQVPGTSAAQFAADRLAMMDYRGTEVLNGPDGPRGHAIRRLRREEFAALETERDAACVIVDWDPDVEPDPASLVEREMGKRLGRPLSATENRALRQGLDPAVLHWPAVLS